MKSTSKSLRTESNHCINRGLGSLKYHARSWGWFFNGGVFLRHGGLFGALLWVIQIQANCDPPYFFPSFDLVVLHD